jgi:hypothetical protein
VVTRHSNSLGPMRCAPHIEGQFLRDAITKLVIADKNWYDAVYTLLEQHQVPKDWRQQFYAHAQAVEAAKETP